jgi:hypothetical protein
MSRTNVYSTGSPRQSDSSSKRCCARLDYTTPPAPMHQPQRVCRCGYRYPFEDSEITLEAGGVGSALVHRR